MSMRIWLKQGTRIAGRGIERGPFTERADSEAEDVLTKRVLIECKLGAEPEDLFVIAYDGEPPLVFHESYLHHMIEDAPNEMIKETLTSLSKRDKETGKIRLLLIKGEEMYYGQTIIPNDIIEKIREMRVGKGN